MKTHEVTLPDVMLIGGTRVALGAGIGLLLADRLGADARRAAGWALLGIGALTTIPLLLRLLGRREARV